MKKIGITAIFVLGCFLFIHAQSIHVATYNVRVDKQTDRDNGNGWPERYPKICELVQAHDFHIFGAQEVESHQLKDMLEILKGYRYIGVGREDGRNKGEYVPIFYRPDIIQLLDSGHFWLSETPDIPSTGWDAALPRICTWGKFKMPEGKTFYVFNTHFDHKGVEARKASARLIVSKIKEIAGDGDAILTGDFNAGDTTEVFHTINDSGIVRDSFHLAGVKLSWVGTANNFDEDIMTKDRLDYIFVSEAIPVKRYLVLTDSYRQNTSQRVFSLPNFPKEIGFRDSKVKFPSDHFPVLVTLDF